MRILSWLRKLLLDGDNRHRRIPNELLRVTSPDGKYDAVIEGLGGSNLAMFIVKSRQSVIGKTPEARVVHYSGPVEVHWLNDHIVEFSVEAERLLPDENPRCEITELDSGLRISLARKS